ncbi:hypothetical protein F2Q69_00039049 [Brassica cretica]|uniref:Uncharacterized protein n=1 Tax=Brassica cretica TaxID=69181 RepID=A0A8S9SEJ4_BRACR|nr:hypothetical protein F2Q69_00039049 [Brassica cretica]
MHDPIFLSIKLIPGEQLALICKCGVSVPDDKRLFKLVSMSGALEELYYRGKTSFPKR